MNTAALTKLSVTLPQLRHVPGVAVLGLSLLLGILAGPEFVMMTVAGACLSWLIENELAKLRLASSK